ncbi:MAG: hypothetical protein HZB77_03505 [Chloroflexi bacterium]|nr:hypothetical protein [Chloroflexota bacterium]
MTSFINPPQHIPFYLKVGLWYAEREAGAEMLPARLLAWYPKAAISSGILESLIAHDEGEINERMLKIVRLQASFAVSCPFCIDMNSVDHEKMLTMTGIPKPFGSPRPEGFLFGRRKSQN